MALEAIEALKDLKAQVYDLLVEQELHKKAFDVIEIKKVELLKQIKEGGLKPNV